MSLEGYNSSLHSTHYHSKSILSGLYLYLLVLTLKILALFEAYLVELSDFK